MRKSVLAFLLLILFITPMLSRAQGQPQISSLKVALWPEFDNPTMLVIYNFTLTPTTQLPANLTLRIPAPAEAPHAVAVGPSAEQVGDVPYTTDLAGEWMEVSFIATMPVVQFEYYDPTLNKQGEIRNYEYHWPGDYAVEAIVIDVQEPLDARQVMVSPSLGSGTRRSDGLVYYTAQWGSLTAGQTFKISLSYQKPTNTLSAERLLVQPSQPLSPEGAGRIRVEGVLPWVLGVLGLTLIVGGGIWYWQSGQKETGRQPRRRRSAAATVVADETKAAADPGIYCHQCGKRAGPGDRFCRSCGTRLRQE